MAVEIEKPCKEGYLCLPPQRVGVIGQLKKSWHKKYCQLYRASKQGIERLEVYENEEEASKIQSMTIITLENCIKITQDPQKNQPHVFIVVTKTSGIHHFAGNSEEDMSEWMSAFQSVAFKDTASRQTIEEDNDLYCSSGDSGVFSVKLLSSEASERCGLQPGNYTLVVAPAELQLRDPEQRILLTWPYRFIRRYGYKSGKFTFEAGRKCTSGEGTFNVEHKNQQEIFRCVSAKMRQIKSLLTGGGESIMCGDNQFQHALGMTARSRSPLPPSPTSVTPGKPLLPLPVGTTPDLTPPPLPIKPMPRKPPRKHPPHGGDKTSVYDDVEVRNDAWKTLGVGTLTHTERAFSPLKQDETKLKGKVFLQPASVNNYDKLQHFGSTTKLNAAPGYRQINTPTPLSLPVFETHDQNELEKEPENIKSARSADDSHHGYGVIRKKSLPNELSSPPHTVYNDMEYALICKPHRVSLLCLIFIPISVGFMLRIPADDWMHIDWTMKTYLFLTFT